MVEWHWSDEIGQSILIAICILVLDFLNLAAHVSTAFVRSFKDTSAEGEFPKAVTITHMQQKFQTITQKRSCFLMHNLIKRT